MPKSRKLRAVLLISGALLALSAGYFLLPPTPSFEPEPYLQKASAYQVEIKRDKWGVPHILGPRDADVTFGLAYAHSEDDFETIQAVIMAARGKLGTMKGPDGAKTDYIVHLLGFWPMVEARYDGLPGPVRALAEGYADGLNYYAAKNVYRTWPGLVPVRGQDVVAGFVFKTPFFYGLDKLLKKIFQDRLDEEGPKGSNGFAVAPHRSADKKTRLIINSHQPFTGPVAWYEAQLRSEEGLDITGGLFPGAPLILHGHNRHLGWASTVNLPDLADLFLLKLDPGDDRRYLLDGKYERLKVETAKLRVRLFGRFYWTFEREVLRSKHGPVIRRDDKAYALRYVGHDEVRQLEQYWRMNRATSFEAWREAMRMSALPSINFIYADAKGNIGMFHNVRSPLRKEGEDWSGVLPGDRSGLIWTKYRAFDQGPHTINPPSGLVFNANNTPFSATDGPGGPDPQAFSKSMGLQQNMTNRALRTLELLKGDDAITEEELLACKFDKRYSARSDVAEARTHLLSLKFDDPVLQEAQKVLAQWDLNTDKKNKGAAIGVLGITPVFVAQLKGDPPKSLRATFTSAAHMLKSKFGRIDVPWGEVNRLRYGGKDLPLGGGPDTLRAIYGSDPAEDGTIYARSGDTYIMLVEWDADGQLRSKSIHQYGASPSGHSNHHVDQAELFANERFKPVLFEAAALEKALEHSYSLGRLKSGQR